MFTIRRMLFSALCLAVGGSILSCQNSVTDPPAIAPTTTLPSATHPAPVAPPTSIIKLQKPRLLGPVLPAIVALPESMKEPLIRVRLTAEESRPPVIKKSAYRGRIESVKLSDGNYVAVNILPIDSYLAGVLAKELYGSWDAETYQTQAIAARTFALFQMLTGNAARQWDVNNDESSQMYGGIAGETAKSRRAVAETRGQVLIAAARGQTGLFCAFYSACIGGASQDPADAWGDPSLPALAARKLNPDIDNNCPKAAWPTMPIAKSDITRCIRSWGERNGFAYLQLLGNIKSVAISKRNLITGRPTQITLTDITGRTALIRAEEFRLAMIYDPQASAPKPLSSNFNIKDAGAYIELTNGHGYGHGIGLSQWGAQALALRGWSHSQILTFYYPTAKLQQLW